MTGTDVTHGRLGWTTIGMPEGAGPYYELHVEHVGWAGTQPNADLNHRAVTWGVKAIQTRINELGFGTAPTPPLAVDGILDLRTALGIGWMQGKVGVKIDGQAGPVTMLHALWPVIRDAWGGGRWTPLMKHIVGGIAAHESVYDPGAVGGEDPDDLGLVQINGPANPTMSEADRFNYRKAFTWALDRVKAAIETPGYTVDAAIAHYFIPAVGDYWAKHQTETFPDNPGLNDKVLKFVQFVRDWDPKF